MNQSNLIAKIKLNACYPIIDSFEFYDVDKANSITSHGTRLVNSLKGDSKCQVDTLITNNIVYVEGQCMCYTR